MYRKFINTKLVVQETFLTSGSRRESDTLSFLQQKPLFYYKFQVNMVIDLERYTAELV